MQKRRTTKAAGAGRVARLGLAASMILAGGAAQASLLPYSVSGSFGVESSGSGAVLSSGIDIVNDNGYYGGWSGSSVAGVSDLEQEFFFGYATALGAVEFDIGLQYYWFLSDSDYKGYEIYTGLGWGPLSFSLAYTLTDRLDANQGDVVLGLGADFSLGYGFSLGLSGEYSFYNDSGKYIPSSGVSSAFNSLDLGLSYDILDTPATVYTTYSIGGKDRDGVSVEDGITVGLSYAFDIF